jgi:hypothetical protein
MCESDIFDKDSLPEQGEGFGGHLVEKNSHTAVARPIALGARIRYNRARCAGAGDPPVDATGEEG